MALTKITPQMFDTSAAGHDFNIDNGTFVVDASANRVGIGTATPSTLLDVNGSVSATTLTVGDILFAGSTISDAADLILDVGGDITLDADGGDVLFKDGGTHFGSIYQNSNNMLIYSAISDADMLLQGNDGGSLITALTLDMSAAGEATFNSNVGIGGSPTKPLTVFTSAASDSARFTDGTNSELLIEHASGNLLTLATGSTSQPFAFAQGSAEAMRISGGNVGIGCTPSVKLHVRGSAVSGATFNADDGLTIEQAGGGGSNINLISSTNTGVLFSDAAARAVGLLNYSHSDNSMRFNTNGSEAMRINASGKIGIGTGASTINADSVLHLKSTQPNIYFEDTDDSKSWRLEAGSVFKVQNITTSTEAFRIDQIGTLAVGTTDTHSWNNVFDGRIRIGARGVLATTTGSTQLGHNFYYDGAYKYIGADYATRYYSNNGEHVWLTAPNGSADGTISFSGSRMVITNGGDVSIGPTHSGFSGWRVLNIRGESTGGMLNFENSSGTRSFTFANQGSGMRYQAHISGGYHRFETNAASNALYITDAGDVGIGAVPAAGVRFQTVHNVADEWVGDFKHTHANAYGLRVDLSGSTSSVRLAFGTYTGGGTGFFVRNDGNVGIGTTGPLKKFDILGEGDGYDQIMVRSVGGNNTVRSGGITGINYSGNQLALINYYTDSGQTYYNIGSMGSTLFRGPTMIRFFTAAQNGTSHTETMRVTNNHIMAGAGGRSADVALEVAGPLKITNNTNTGNGGVSQTLTNMTMGNSGKLIINFHAIGTMTTGDTIVFTYNAISWKSWFFKIRFSSTGGYIGELWAGGYNNNSDGYQVLNPRYYAAGSGDGASNTTVEGATLTVTRSGQANTMTLTLNNNHVHPLFEIEYACGGGEGRPNSSRASISINS